MRAIIWKEIRENAKWAVLLMLAAAACMVWTIYVIGQPRSWQGDFSALNEVFFGFQIITAVGFPIAATLLGLLQTIPEQRRDQWAFLVHRPLTLTQLFFGKAVAGLILYVLIMLVPLTVAVIWSAWPGHLLGPFAWEFLLPFPADLAGGVAFYFAAMLAGIRRARWYGSRALPVALAVWCEICVVASPTLWLALLAAAVGTAILLIAAWGSFIASGQYCSQPRIAKAALGIVLLTGVLSVGFLAVMIVSMATRGQSVPEWTNYYLDRNDRVLQVTMGYDGQQTIRKITDLDGNRITGFEGKPFKELRLMSFHYLALDQGPWIATQYRNFNQFVRSLLSKDQVLWCYVVSERLIVGYDRRTNLRIGAIGPEGFSPAGVQPKRLFPDGVLEESLSGDRALLVFSSAAYRVDLDARRAGLLAEVGADESIVGSGFIPIDIRERESDSQVAGHVQATAGVGIVTTSRILVFASAPDSTKPVLTIPRHYSEDKCPNIRATAKLDKGYAFWYEPGWFTYDEGGRTTHIVVVSATGEELKRYDLPPIVFESPPTSWPHALWAVVTPVSGPVVVAGIQVGWNWYWFGWDAAIKDLQQLKPVFTGRDGPFMILCVVVLLASAVVWAAIVYVITRRYSFSKRQAFWWMLGGFLLGPAGVLTMLALREWPVHVGCASCGRKRLVDRERCEYCGTPFPPMPPTGIEIFDEPEAVAARG